MVDKRNAGKNTCVFPGEPNQTTVQLIIGRNIGSATNRPKLPIPSPSPAICPLFFSEETFLSNAL